MVETIRPALPNEAEAIISLWSLCELTRPWNDSRQDYDRALGTSNSTILIALNSDVILGSVMVGFDGHRGWLYYLAVDPEYRRKGIAHRLVIAAEDYLRRLGCPKVELMVRNDNDTAKKFYQELGWEHQAVNVYARWLNE